MTRRIPHQNELIEGTESVETYAENHENNVSSHFGAFLKEFDRLDINGKSLEIGSGPGFLTALIAQKRPKAEITALEPSSEMIRYAKTYVQKKGVNGNVTFIQGSVEDRQLMENLGQFDLVYSTFSLYHWEKPKTAWRYLFNRVNRNGTLFIHDLKRVSWLYHLPFDNGLFESVRAAYTPVEVGDMLMNMGIGTSQYTLKTPFPYFWMSILINKSMS